MHPGKPMQILDLELKEGLQGKLIWKLKMIRCSQRKKMAMVLFHHYEVHNKRLGIEQKSFDNGELSYYYYNLY